MGSPNDIWSGVVWDPIKEDKIWILNQFGRVLVTFGRVLWSTDTLLGKADPNEWVG